MIPFCFGIMMSLLIVTNNVLIINEKKIFEFPEVTCFMIALFWDCCIRIGLIPTNKGYGEFMRMSSLAIQITDKNGEPIYKSKTATDLTEVQYKETMPIKLNEDTLLFCEPISGGYSYWQDDISELNRINRELAEIQSQLSEETELIRLENELKEKQLSIVQRTKIYDLIATRTLPQSEKISWLAEQALSSTDTAIRNKNANIICVLGAYIKRYANLTLLAERDNWVSSAELGMAIAESLRYLGNAGIPGDYMGSVDVKLQSQSVIVMYEIFEELLERYIEDLQAVYVTIVENENLLLKISFEGVSVVFGTEIIEKLDEFGIKFNLEREDEVSYMRFCFSKEAIV